MSRRSEDRYVQPSEGWAVFGYVLAAFLIVSVVAALVLGVWGLDWHSQHVACLRLHEQTSNATRMARSGMGGECYIEVDGRWIPADRYRGIEGGVAP